MSCFKVYWINQLNFINILTITTTTHSNVGYTYLWILRKDSQMVNFSSVYFGRREENCVFSTANNQMFRPLSHGNSVNSHRGHFQGRHILKPLHKKTKFSQKQKEMASICQNVLPNLTTDHLHYIVRSNNLMGNNFQKPQCAKFGKINKVKYLTTVGDA